MATLNCFDLQFYDDDLKKEFNEIMNNNFSKLFSEVNVNYAINYASARAVVKNFGGDKNTGAYSNVLFDMLDVVENGELIKSAYRDYHASAWVKIQHAELGGSFVKLMNRFKKAIKAFDKGTSWNIVFYTQILEMGMN